MLLNGLLAAVPLALIGYALAHAGGFFMLSTGSRDGANEQAAAVTETLAGKLPFTLAAAGFLFVCIGECFAMLWRKPNGEGQNSKAA